MTRLLQVMAGAEHGGAEAFFERLALALQRAGQAQRAVIRPYPARVETLRRGGVETDTLPFGGWLDFTTRRGLARIIRDYQPRVVLSWMNRATRLCPRGDFVHVARLGGYYDLKYYRGCDHLIANTRGIADYLVAQGWPGDRVHILPNFPAADDAPPLPRAQFATPAGAPLALAMGRLHRNKGFDVLLDALAKTAGIFLWLAGEGPEGAALEKQAAALGLLDRVRFLGWRDDASSLLASCDMLVSAARLEPLGNTIVEAWAAKRPVIAAAAAGPRELVAENQTGLLVPCDDAGALARAMARLAADTALRARLAQAGFARYEARFSPARVIAFYNDFLAKVAA
jgi:glycosyltransferase involved in cell wall biosynthesis